MSIKHDSYGVKVAFLGGFFDKNVFHIREYDTSKKLTWIRNERKPRALGFQTQVYSGTAETEQYSLLVLSRRGETKMFYVHEGETIETMKEKLRNNEFWNLSDTIGYDLD